MFEFQSNHKKMSCWYVLMSNNVKIHVRLNMQKQIESQISMKNADQTIFLTSGLSLNDLKLLNADLFTNK